MSASSEEVTRGCKRHPRCAKCEYSHTRAYPHTLVSPIIAQWWQNQDNRQFARLSYFLRLTIAIKSRILGVPVRARALETGTRYTWLPEIDSLVGTTPTRVSLTHVCQVASFVKLPVSGSVYLFWSLKSGDEI